MTLDSMLDSVAPREFRSAIDWWVVILPGLACLGGVAAAVLTLSGPAMWVTLAAALMTADLPLWLALTTRYAVADGMLDVRCAVWRWRIPLASIRNVRRIRSLAAAPAFSSKRLELFYDDRSILVSPRDAEAFTAALAPFVGEQGDVPVWE